MSQKEAAFRVRQGSPPSDSYVLESGEFGYDAKNDILKIGDGTNEWGGRPEILRYGDDPGLQSLYFSAGTSAIATSYRGTDIVYAGRRSWYGTCATAADIAAKVVTCPQFFLKLEQR